MKLKTEHYILGAAAVAVAYAITKKQSPAVAVSGSIISKLRAIEIANGWHGGQWSTLYQFASSGEYLPYNHANYIQEILNNLQPEYRSASGNFYLRKKDEKELKSLLKWFEYKGKEHGIKTTYDKHNFYGYKIVKVETPGNWPIRPVYYPN